MNNFNNYSAEWDQRRAFQERLDNYIRNTTTALATSNFTLAFSQCRAMHSEIGGWINNLKKKNSDSDIKDLKEIRDKCKLLIEVYKHKPLSPNNMYDTIHDYLDKLNELSHKYGLVMQQKTTFGGVGDV